MRKNFEMIKGDTLAFGVEIAFDDTPPTDLNSANFSVKRNPDDGYIFSKFLNAGIQKYKQVDNKLYYRVRVDPNDTAKLEAGFYYYDLEIRVNGDVFTILNGLLIVENDITRY